MVQTSYRRSGLYCTRRPATPSSGCAHFFGRMSGMSGWLDDGNCCKSCFYRGLMVVTGIVLRRPDKTGHFRTLGSGQPSGALRHLRKCLIVSHSVSRGSQGTERGRYSLFKESAGPQRQVGEELREMLNAEAARTRMVSRSQNSSPSTLREFVALFCTKRRDKRRVWGWEVVDWQGVTNFEESAENYFGRMLLSKEMGDEGNAARRGGFTTRCAGGTEFVVAHCPRLAAAAKLSLRWEVRLSSSYDSDPPARKATKCVTVHSTLTDLAADARE